MPLVVGLTVQIGLLVPSVPDGELAGGGVNLVPSNAYTLPVPSAT